MVLIDEKTYDTPPRPTWPFDRDWHSQVIERLDEAGAKVIAYDVQFTEESGETDEAIEKDNRLIETIRATGPNRFVLATTEVSVDGLTNIFGGSDEAIEYSRGVESFSSYPFDLDGRTRRTLFDQHGVPSFDDRRRRAVPRAQARAAGRRQRLHRFRGPAGHDPGH